MPAFRRTTPDSLSGPRLGWIAVAAIGALLVGLGFESRLRAQSGAPASKKAAPKAGDAERAKPEQPFERFRLAHVPVGATSFMIDRPARTMREGGAAVRGGAQESLLVSLGDTDPGFRLKVEAASLDQIVRGSIRSPSVDVVVHRGRSEFLVARSAAPMDWKDCVLRSMTGRSGEKAKWVDVPLEGRVYSRIDGSSGSAAKAPGKGPGDRLAELLEAPRLETRPTHGPFFYFPDDRTLVAAASEDVIRGIIRQPAGAVPELARTDAWKRVSRDQLACAWSMDRQDMYPPDAVAAMWMEIVALVVPLRSSNPRQFFVGLGTDDKLRIAVDEVFGDASETKKTADARTRELGTMRGAAIVTGFQRDPGMHPMFRWFFELSLNGRFRPDGRRLAFVSSCRMTMTELDGFFGGTPKPAEEARPSSP
ncbi:MAG: hypothetical protein ACYC61_33880 [Isosphaeraceae bacterium]